MTRRKFSREFKIEAVRLVTDRDVTVAQAARDLDVAESVLRRWMRELTATPAAAFPGNGQMRSRNEPFILYATEVGLTPGGCARATRQRGSQPASPGSEPSRYDGATAPGLYVASRIAMASGARAGARHAPPTVTEFASIGGRRRLLRARKPTGTFGNPTIRVCARRAGPDAHPV